ncbi:hypothetical protein HZA86_04170 [Candidatus Uhrbacteria bacterium]|nr:hypothetical protein [Candidatus Uhrbacteria bacterium]
MHVEEKIRQLQERNARVEVDKAWETSWTRALVIAGFTYLIASVWLMIIGDSSPLLKALVPVAGFLLSTFSLPRIKSRWLKNRHSKVV